MHRSNDFTQGDIFLPLLRFSLPILAALILQTAYGAVDLWMVGRFATAADVSAVSTGSQLMHTITCVVTGLTMGTTVMPSASTIRVIGMTALSDSWILSFSFLFISRHLSMRPGIIPYVLILS